MQRLREHDKQIRRGTEKLWPTNGEIRNTPVLGAIHEPQAIATNGIEMFRVDVEQRYRMSVFGKDSAEERAHRTGAEYRYFHDQNG